MRTESSRRQSLGEVFNQSFVGHDGAAEFSEIGFFSKSRFCGDGFRAIYDPIVITSEVTHVEGLPEALNLVV